MVQLYGRFFSKRELLKHVGRIEQVGGIRRFVLDEGNESGTGHIQVRTGAGLCYYISPDRGMDISLAEMNGIPVSYQSSVGDVHPAYFDPTGIEWLRTFPGGLMTTCGLTSMGANSVDKGEAFGLHGRISHQPAKQLGLEGRWVGDEYEMKLKGKTTQTRFFGENLEMRRTITSRLGENRILVEDQVENLGFADVELMILYHCNFGYPFLSPSLSIEFPEGTVESMDSGRSTEGYRGFEAPTPGYEEQVNYHRPRKDISHPVVKLRNEQLGLAASITYKADTLPCLAQWKQPGQGAYVMGIEPANAFVEGKVVERSKRGLVTIHAGQTLDYELAFDFEKL